MLKVNLAEVGTDTFSSPKGTYQLQRRDISRHLIQKDKKEREPAFEIEHVILPSGKKNFPYHQHATWWELYFILSGDGTVRTETGYEKIEANDCFIFPPGDPHQIINDSSNDLTYLVIANNTPFELGYYPDSDKVWFAGTLAKGQKEGLTKVQSGFTNDYWKDEE
ncbi:hypothetical protein CMK19_12825 [Candidatus Poribacteria bacterium]|nr:hypothetical protein [Candidatus Poribacteria bacterium]|tara:strand:+ start:252 stop:746 length:495 start_codon:yes stop_codon:yes gene_type:complete